MITGIIGRIVSYFFCFCIGIVISTAFIALINSVGLLRNIIVRYKLDQERNLLCWIVVIGLVLSSVIKFYPNDTFMLGGFGAVIAAVIGFFYGNFIGYLALGLTEVFDLIPLFNNKLGFRYNFKLLVITIALGKTIGSLLYFLLPGFYTYR